MNLNTTEQDGITIFTINGRIDTQGAMALESALYDALQAGKYKMVLDVTNVRYINSSALRTFADVLTENRNNGGDLFLVGLQDRIKRVFQIIGFDKFFVFYDDLNKAISDYAMVES